MKLINKIKNIPKRLAKVLTKRQSNIHKAINYEISSLTIYEKLLYLVFYYFVSFIILYIFYKSFVFSLIMSLLVASLLMPFKQKNELLKRKKNLRVQFQDLLSALDVAMRSGENINTAFKSTLDSLLLIYNEKADIIIEVKQILSWLSNNIPLKDALANFAERSNIVEITNFSAVINVIEGKSDKSGDVIKQTQRLISETIEVELEIDTIISDKKNEQTIMLILPVIIVATMNFLGNGFMDALHTTIIGRVVATLALIIFACAYIISTKITNIRV